MKFGLERIQTLPKLLKELANGLRKLSFEDNFQSVVVEVEIDVNEEINVPHRLQAVPIYYIIGSMSGNGKIINGDAPWTNTSISLKNVGIEKTNITVIIFRD